MKKTLLASILISASFSVWALPVTNKSPQKDQLGYSYGYVMGRTNADTLKDLNLEAFIQGLKEGSEGKSARLTEEEMARALTQYKKQAEAEQLIEFQKMAAKNGQAGAVFLAENMKKPRIISIKSGLQYQIIRAGQGKTPKPTSQVKVHYEGRLLDGTVVDSSIARSQPVDFQLNQVIEGWSEGLQTMKEGGKSRFFIPAKLAYGEIGSGDAIPPNSTLIFDVELLQILP